MCVCVCARARACVRLCVFVFANVRVGVGAVEAQESAKTVEARIAALEEKETILVIIGTHS